MGIWEHLPADQLLAELSLWSADLARLGDDLQRVAPHADLFHIDVSDGQLVPGLLFFPDLVAALRPLTTRPFHVHLMVADPRALIDEFAAAGADIISLQAESDALLEPALAQARARGLATGLALSLDTPLEAALPLLDQLDLVILMGTRLGVKGQDLAPEACPRIAAMRQLIELRGYGRRIKIVADGGIREHTVPALRAAGADSVVLGSLAFKSPDLAQTCAWLRALPGPQQDGADEAARC